MRERERERGAVSCSHQREGKKSWSGRVKNKDLFIILPPFRNYFSFDPHNKQQPVPSTPFDCLLLCCLQTALLARYELNLYICTNIQQVHSFCNRGLTFA
jgi:hypothetical protein